VAEEELDAVMSQIEDAMEPEQIAAIADMYLTSDDQTAAMGAMSEGASAEVRGVGSMAPDGDILGEAMGGPGRGEGLGDVDLDPEEMEELMAERGIGAGDRTLPMLSRMVAEFLQGKVPA
jgi:hypothetical protein